MGGPVALSMYQREPQRFASLMLIDTAAAAANPAEAGLWRGVAEMVRQKGVDAIHPVLMKEMLTGDTRAHQPAIAGTKHLAVVSEGVVHPGAGLGGWLVRPHQPHGPEPG